MSEAIWVKKIEPFKYVPFLGGSGNDRTHSLYDTWYSMLRRVYNTGHIQNHSYRTHSVCARWHTFAYFAHDVVKLDGYGVGTELDKDYFGSNQYNPESCRWLSRAENTAYTGTPVYVGDKLFVSHRDAARHLKVVSSNIASYLESKSTSSRSIDGLIIASANIRLAIKEGYVARYKD